MTVTGTVHDTESLTYRELAARLGVKLESARTTVRRKRWRKITGNDGTIRILVPVEALSLSLDKGSDSPGDSPAVYTRELETRIKGLRVLLAAEARLTAAETRRAETAEAERDKMRLTHDQMLA